MADSKWKLSGGIGAPTEDVQVMTQGVGFPLRPVDGVPEDDDSLDGLPIAQGSFTQWMGAFQTNVIYPTGSIVRDGDWLMVANKPTLAHAAPVPVGTPTWGMSDTPAFATQSDESVVYSGHSYTFTESGWVRGLRVWVSELTASTNYRIIVADVTDPNAPKATVFEEPVLAVDEWKIIALVDTLVTAGTKWRIFIDALNSGADTGVTGGWTYNGSSQNGAPAVGGWNNRNQQDTIRISKTDLDAADRSTELAGMIPGTTLTFAETLRPEFSSSYRITGDAIDEGTYFSYAVELTGSGTGGVPSAGLATTMTATVPIAQPTEYVELAAGAPTPTWATVAGILEFNGEDQVGDANGYGVDINFDGAVVSPDWDVMSFSG